MRTGILLVSAVVLMGIATARADDQWQKKHPRRAQVNQRLQNQQNRVDQGLASGKLNQNQANKIQNQDARIRAQEQRDAAANNGHITKGQQQQLNREENGVSREIKRDESHNAQGPQSVPAAPPASSP